MRDDLIKFLIKVLDEDKDELCWEHICYAPRELYLRFIDKMGIERSEAADFMARWAKQDFNIDLSMTTDKDIRLLKELIVDKYKSAYPHLLRTSDTDHQGWVRVWVSSHMERELAKLR